MLFIKVFSSFAKTFHFFSIYFYSFSFIHICFFLCFLLSLPFFPLVFNHSLCSSSLYLFSLISFLSIMFSVLTLVISSFFHLKICSFLSFFWLFPNFCKRIHSQNKTFSYNASIFYFSYFCFHLILSEIFFMPAFVSVLLSNDTSCIDNYISENENKSSEITTILIF